MPLIFQKCKDKYKGLELEDRLSEGYTALLYAIRTYKISYGCFEDYFDSQFKKIMKQKNAKIWAERKLESLISLDAPIKNHDNKEGVLGTFIGENTIDIA